jgi:biotin carboxyl carrier protein
MDIKDIKRIIELMKENELSEFELAEEGFRISLRRKGFGVEPQVIMTPMHAPAPAAAVACRACAGRCPGRPRPPRRT